MTFKQLRTQAELTCQFFQEHEDGEMTFCSHPDNKEITEGNCHPDNCPILDLITDEAIDDLFGDGSQFERDTQEGVTEFLESQNKPFHIYTAKR